MNKPVFLQLLDKEYELSMRVQAEASSQVCHTLEKLPSAHRWVAVYLAQQFTEQEIGTLMKLSRDQVQRIRNDLRTSLWSALSDSIKKLFQPRTKSALRCT